MGWHASATHEVILEDCRIPKENLLGDPNRGLAQHLTVLETGRITIAAMSVGLAQACLDEALRYAKERIQFGRPICKQQSIAFKLADMVVKIELARNMLYKACWLCDNKRPFTTEAAMSKLYTSEIAREVADEAVQIHGGYGLFKDYEGERFYRDQRLLQIGEGTSEILRLVISRAIGC